MNVIGRKIRNSMELNIIFGLQKYKKTAIDEKNKCNYIIIKKKILSLQFENLAVECCLIYRKQNKINIIL